MKYGFHLFPFGGGRPYANNYMRELFGPMCDAPSPKEYLDISTDAETTKALDTCIKTGKNQAFSIYCRQLKASRVPSVMSINHMQSVKHEGKILYR